MKMIPFLLISLIVGCAASQPAPTQLELDDSDAGVYGVVHRDGHLTDMRFRLVKGDERWRLDARHADGAYEDVTCEKECQLVNSAIEDVHRFMGGEPPHGMEAMCVHNEAFAFCRVTGPGLGQRRYVLVGLKTPIPTPLRIQKIE